MYIRRVKATQRHYSMLMELLCVELRVLCAKMGYLEHYHYAATLKSTKYLLNINRMTNGDMVRRMDLVRNYAQGVR